MLTAVPPVRRRAQPDLYYGKGYTVTILTNPLVALSRHVRRTEDRPGRRTAQQLGTTSGSPPV